MKWFVRMHTGGSNKFVLTLSYDNPMDYSPALFNDKTKQLERVLNRELPNGKLRQRRRNLFPKQQVVQG